MNIVEQLLACREVESTDAFTVDGEISSWLRIASPSGWVFGAAIDPQ